MNVREEDRQKSSCPSRGLGLAAAAIGVGVGAALYYFFSKRPENPDGEGSTTGWQCEQPHVFDPLHENNEDTDSYTTISENSTTDTSIIETISDDSGEPETYISSDESNVNNLSQYFDSDSEDFNLSGHGISDLDSTNTTDNGNNDVNINDLLDSLPRILTDMGSDSDATEWDVTNSSMGIPDAGMSPSSSFVSLFSNIGAFVSPRQNRRNRERSWSLEECSICFDVILKDQQVTTLPCTHHFHSACIAPWLQEQQTCPNCRKAAE